MCKAKPGIEPWLTTCKANTSFWPLMISFICGVTNQQNKRIDGIDGIEKWQTLSLTYKWDCQAGGSVRGRKKRQSRSDLRTLGRVLSTLAVVRCSNFVQQNHNYWSWKEYRIHVLHTADISLIPKHCTCAP